MTREYIIRCQVDDDGHEYDMTRVRELVRCGECENRTLCFSDVIMSNKYQTTTVPYSVEFCSLGERKK